MKSEKLVTKIRIEILTFFLKINDIFITLEKRRHVGKLHQNNGHAIQDEINIDHARYVNEFIHYTKVVQRLNLIVADASALI